MSIDPRLPSGLLTATALAILAMLPPFVVAGEALSLRVLHAFDTPEAQQTWRAVNDGVMGGLSRGRARVRASEERLEFSGTLSLENRGGFSSIRSQGPALDLRGFEGIAVRVRGDGRRYSLTIRTDHRIMAGSYRIDLPTEKGEWQTVKLPFERFEATSFGRRLRGAPPVNVRDVRSVGFILADKKAGDFHLDVDWIAAYRTADDEEPASGSRTPQS